MSHRQEPLYRDLAKTRQTPARDVKPGDVIIRANVTDQYRVTAVRPVTTTQAGRPRRRRPVQVTIQSESRHTRALYSDTVFGDSLIWILDE